LLVLFAFGITPKRTLHNLVANHKDGSTRSRSLNLSTTDLSKASFNCQCDNLISESPFVAEGHAAYTNSSLFFSAYLDSIVPAQYSAELFPSGLRGPPAC
jgi:hypothetical protein